MKVIDIIVLKNIRENKVSTTDPTRKITKGMVFYSLGDYQVSPYKPNQILSTCKNLLKENLIRVNDDKESLQSVTLALLKTALKKIIIILQQVQKKI